MKVFLFFFAFLALLSCCNCRVYQNIDQFGDSTPPLVILVSGGGDTTPPYDWYSPYFENEAYAGPPAFQFRTTTAALGGQRDTIIGYESVTPQGSVAVVSVVGDRASIALPLLYIGGVYYQWDGDDTGGNSSAAFPGATLNVSPGIGEGVAFANEDNSIDFTFGGKASGIFLSVSADNDVDYFFDTIDSNGESNTIHFLVEGSITETPYFFRFDDSRWSSFSFDWTQVKAFQLKIFTFAAVSTAAIDTEFRLLRIAGYEISGTVSLDATCDGSIDSIIIGEQVDLYVTGNISPLTTTVTDANGEFHFTDSRVTDGSYTVCLNNEGSPLCSGSTLCRNITVLPFQNSGNDITGIDFILFTPPTPSATPSPSLTPTQTPSVTQTNSNTPSSTASLSSSPTSTPTQTSSDTPTSTVSLSSSQTSSTTQTNSNTPSTTISAAASPSNTPSTTTIVPISPSNTPSRTISLSTSPTSTISTAASTTISATASPSNTPSTTTIVPISPSNTPSTITTTASTPSTTISAAASPSNTPSTTVSRTTYSSPSGTISAAASNSNTPSTTISTSSTTTRSGTPSSTTSISRSASSSLTAGASPSQTPSQTATPTKTPVPPVSVVVTGEEETVVVDEPELGVAVAADPIVFGINSTLTVGGVTQVLPSAVAVASAAIDINLYDENGNAIQPNGTVVICFPPVEGSDLDRYCLAYLDEELNTWVCDNSNVEETDGEICSSTVHFTIFALIDKILLEEISYSVSEYYSVPSDFEISYSLETESRYSTFTYIPITSSSENEQPVTLSFSSLTTVDQIPFSSESESNGTILNISIVVALFAIFCML